MHIVVSDIARLYRPTRCERRVYLSAQPCEVAEATPYAECLMAMGIRHEQEHLARLGEFLDLSGLPFGARTQATADAISKRVPVIYQAGFSANFEGVTIAGYPDFLIWNEDGYRIRDSKLSRHVDEKHHVEIALQLQLYGWLYEQGQGTAPKGLEVHAGSGDIIPIEYDGGAAALDEVRRIIRLRELSEEPYEPLGWTKCLACGYRDHCWRDADKLEDVALVPDVDQGLARVLFDKGIRTPTDLLKAMDAVTLADIKRPSGDKMKKVGVKSGRILRDSEVFTTRIPQIVACADIPKNENYVMFDLEGIPPQLEDVSRIYLWGTQVFGEKPSTFEAAVSEFGVGADEKCWLDFLAIAKRICNEYGDIPWVHYAAYESTNIKEYVKRYGDPDGIAERVLGNLLNLHPICKNSLALPIPSYSLKVIEKYIGFKRSQDEYGGTWAMAKFIEAIETENGQQRDSIMAEILKYNSEDLKAMWAVFGWMQKALKKDMEQYEVSG